MRAAALRQAAPVLDPDERHGSDCRNGTSRPSNAPEGGAGVVGGAVDATIVEAIAAAVVVDAVVDVVGAAVAAAIVVDSTVAGPRLLRSHQPATSAAITPATLTMTPASWITCWRFSSGAPDPVISGEPGVPETDERVCAVAVGDEDRDELDSQGIRDVDVDAFGLAERHVERLDRRRAVKADLDLELDSGTLVVRNGDVGDEPRIAPAGIDL